jgi:hypothetical protein
MFVNVSYEENDPDILARFINEHDGYEVTILTTPEDVLQEDGPVVNQISEDRITVIFSNEYVERKLIESHEKNKDEFGEKAFAVGFAVIVSKALAAAEEKLHPPSW